MALRRHTRGNSDTKVLKSLEDPEKLFKKKDKEKIGFPLFGASSSQDSPIDLEWEVNVGRSLLKTKTDSDLKNTKFNSCRLESYLLDSLWRDLQQTTKVETFSSQNTQKSLVPLNPVNTQKEFTSSSTPLHGSFVHSPTIFPSKPQETI